MRRSLGLLGGLWLGAVLLVAAWAKLLDPEGFARQIVQEGLDFLLPAFGVAVLALALEIGLGSALVLGLRPTWLKGLATGLVVFFVGLTARSYWRFLNGTLEEGAACGCFGNLLQRTPAEAFWQDLALLVPPLVLLWLAPRSSASRGWRWALVALLTLAGAIFAWRAPELPLDDLATRIGPGTTLEGVCIGREADRVCLSDLLPEAMEGEAWVVLSRLDEATWAEGGVDALNEIAWGGTQRLVLVTDAELTEVQRFQWEIAPAFQVREAPSALFQGLFRRLPRSFLVRDGQVVETRLGLPDYAP